MTVEIESANNLVKLFSDYERYALKMGYSINRDYSKAVAVAIMALEKSKNT
jgi:hypothetical protein